MSCTMPGAARGIPVSGDARPCRWEYDSHLARRYGTNEMTFGQRAFVGWTYHDLHGI